ncbi:hypothetical protein SPBRAN_1141 [uncultured Candidatus Thioglobus sp.]|nr:hypothetical protein SPBRAN_1141 [uncultured Candidatus Thioglobus sp.]
MKCIANGCQRKTSLPMKCIANKCQRKTSLPMEKLHCQWMSTKNFIANE